MQDKKQKKQNPWIIHVKKECEKLKIPYAQAISDQRVKDSYKKKNLRVPATDESVEPTPKVAKVPEPTPKTAPKVAKVPASVPATTSKAKTR